MCLEDCTFTRNTERMCPCYIRRREVLFLNVSVKNRVYSPKRSQRTTFTSTFSYTIRETTEVRKCVESDETLQVCTKSRSIEE